MKIVVISVFLMGIFNACSKDAASNACIDPSKIGKSTKLCCLPDPVCGCDGVEYFNECYAENTGVISWTDGPCPKDKK